jgi:hypothetical protein
LSASERTASRSASCSSASWYVPKLGSTCYLPVGPTGTMLARVHIPGTGAFRHVGRHPSPD